MAQSSLLAPRSPNAAKPGLAAARPRGHEGVRPAKPGLARGGWIASIAAVGAVCWVGAGCDSGATGIEGCRAIEQTRCRAVQGCPGTPIVSYDDVANCELFYRDHCLHGMADGLDPDQGTVDACVTAIGLARACQDAGLRLGPCNDLAAAEGTEGPTLIAGASPDVTGCQAVQNPEILLACNFLAAIPATGAAGGTTSAGGAGGTGGQGGAGG